MWSSYTKHTGGRAKVERSEYDGQTAAEYAENLESLLDRFKAGNY